VNAARARPSAPRGETGRPAPLPEEARVRARRRALWAGARVERGRVLVLGTEQGTLERELARRGLEVVSFEEREEALAAAREALRALSGEARARIAFEPRDLLAAEQRPGSFDHAVIGDLLVRHPQPGLLLRAALRQLRPGGTLLVAIPFGAADDAAAIHAFSLSSFAALARPHCEANQLSLSDDSIYFAGVNRPPSEQGWSRFSPAWMLTQTESAAGVLKRRLLRSIETLGAERVRASESLRYRIGDLLVEAAQHPGRAVRIPLALARLYWKRRRGRNAALSVLPASSAVDLPPYPLPRADASRRPVVASILNRFALRCWQYEGYWVPITRQSWQEQLEALRPDLLFVESGREGDAGDWPTLLSEDSQARLAQIAAHCRAAGIPTVLWNQEDPRHLGRCAGIARLFDHIFTTDANCIPLYAERCGHERVYALPLAAQPALHNPMRPPGCPRIAGCFAEIGFAGHDPDRDEALRVLLDPALAQGLHLFDRSLPGAQERFQYPARYRGAIQGALSPERMLTAYRAYRVMLNVNPVTASPTLFAGRVLESLACGTPVISTASAGMDALLAGAVRVAAREQDTRGHLKQLLGSPARYDREAHLGYRRVHREHTYAHRLRTVLGAIGKPLPGGPDWPRVTILLSTNRPQNVEQALQSYARQTYPNRELILILNQSRFDLAAVRALAQTRTGVRAIQLDETHTLGQCLNAGLDLATGDYIAKMDDDDLYGAEYLWDLVLAARFSQADVTGKGVYFAYVSAADLMGVRYVTHEHSFSERGLAGGTLLVKRGVFDRVRFQAVPRGTDTHFLYDCEGEGFSFYSADRYNYVMVRQADPGKHTWQVDDQKILARCEQLRTGLALGRAMI